MLVKLAESVLTSDDMSKSAVKMIQRYEALLQKSDVNLVNCVTMLHRLGLIFNSLEHQEPLFAKSTELLKELIWLLCKFGHDLDPRQMANVIWSLGKLDRSVLAIRKNEFSVPQLYSIIFERSLEFACFKPQEIASFLVGLANLRLRLETCEDIVQHLLNLAQVNVQFMKPQELSNILWSLASLNCKTSKTRNFALRVMDQMMLKFENFSPQNSTNVIWALAKLDLRNESQRILPFFEQDIKFRREVYSKQGLALVFWSFAKLRYLPEKLTLIQSSNYLISNLDTLSCQSIGHFLYAFALFGYRSSDVEYKDQLRNQLIARRVEFSPQLLCMVLWSLAIGFQLDCELFSILLQEIENKDWKRLISASDRRQLYQCLLHLESFESTNFHIEDSELLRQSKEDWKNGQTSKWTDSVSLSILRILETMGFVAQHQDLATSGDLHLVIDSIVGLNNGKRIAIEVTIARHRFWNCADRVEGTRIWMVQVLRRHGFQVLQVDAKEWKKLSTIERKQLLKSKLRVSL